MNLVIACVHRNRLFVFDTFEVYFLALHFLLDLYWPFSKA